jgi:hypothetical protein
MEGNISRRRRKRGRMIVSKDRIHYYIKTDTPLCCAMISYTILYRYALVRTFCASAKISSLLVKVKVGVSTALMEWDEVRAKALLGAKAAPMEAVRAKVLQARANFMVKVAW